MAHGTPRPRVAGRRAAVASPSRRRVLVLRRGRVWGMRSRGHDDLSDVTRIFYKPGEIFSFWDYQRGAWQKNEGIRIAHILASPIAADQITDLTIDKEERDKDKPSDHVPIIAEINI